MKYKVQMPVIVFVWLDKGVNITIRLRLPIVRVKPDISGMFWTASKKFEDLRRR